MEYQETAKQQGGRLGNRPRFMGGFSLIELMVAMFIVIVLAKVAIPAFKNQLRESHRADAKTALLDLAAREEKYFAAYNTYTSGITNLYGSSASSSTWPLYLPSGPTQTVTYQLAQPLVFAGSNTAPPAYSLSAAPSGDQVNDLCGTYSLASSGTQSVSAVGAPTNCW